MNDSSVQCLVIDRRCISWVQGSPFKVIQIEFGTVEHRRSEHDLI